MRDRVSKKLWVDKSVFTRKTTEDDYDKTMDFMEWVISITYDDYDDFLEAFGKRDFNTICIIAWRLAVIKSEDEKFQELYKRFKSKLSKFRTDIDEKELEEHSRKYVKQNSKNTWNSQVNLYNLWCDKMRHSILVWA